MAGNKKSGNRGGFRPRQQPAKGSIFENKPREPITSQDECPMCGATVNTLVGHKCEGDKERKVIQTR